MIKLLLLLISLLGSSYASAAQAPLEPVTKLQSEWAKINYSKNAKTQMQSFEKLSDKADALCNAHPNSAELHIWNGIIKSSFAGAKGGLSALGLAKEARQEFELAMDLDPLALNGSAFTSLGILYAKVPGWPVSFGDKKKAKELLEKGLSLNPNGIDSNYFYAVYLLDLGDYEKAEYHLLKAKDASPRANRPLADAGRHEEIDNALNQILQTLSGV